MDCSGEDRREAQVKLVIVVPENLPGVAGLGDACCSQADVVPTGKPVGLIPLGFTMSDKH